MSEDKSDEIDHYLLKRVASGDEQAFEMLYHKYNKVFYAAAIEILVHRTEADEAVQDAFLRIWKKARFYDSTKSRAFSWMYLVARRVYLNRRKDLQRRGTLISDEVSVLKANEANHSNNQHTETHEQFTQILSELPEAQSRCLRMALIKGYTAKEISEQIGKPIGTIKTWIRRGTLTIRERFKQ